MCGTTWWIIIQMIIYTVSSYRLAESSDSCLALGVEDGTINSNKLTASSEFNNYYKASQGRLNTVRAWAARYNIQGQWIQADLGSEKRIVGVITQGRSDKGEWVESYKVESSTDGNNFAPVLGSSGQVEIFSANSDRNTEVKNIFNSVVYAQFIRINPVSWHGHICLRFELLGADSVVALGVEDGTIHSDQLTASSEYNDDLKAYRGRLNTVPDAGGSGAWAARHNNNNQWIQTNLGSEKLVVGVITQGRSSGGQWVTSYKVNYSTDGNNFTPVLGSSGQVETFSANSDGNTKVKNIFKSVVYAQFIRINPISWNRHISLRFELLGAAALDITVYSSIPLTSPNNENEFRGYSINKCKTTDLTVGILYKDVDGKDNVTWADTGYSGNNNDDTSEQFKDMPDNKIFNTESEVAYRLRSDFVYLGVKNLPNSKSDGVFSFEARTPAMVSSSAIVVTSSSATIRMQFRTLTVGIGESVTINVSEDGGYNDLRWRHNYGDAIQMWNGNSSVTIENIRAKDGGVYECYKSESLDDNRGIMRLIVRDCPLPKWSPPECEMDCPVCYNGGVCDDKTGLCICPAGFRGEYCQTSCGSNNFGRDCDVVCKTGDEKACKGKLFCPSDPFGCTCINGYGGDDCNTECENDHYGADCRQVCHCDSGGCDRTGNCTSGSSCSSNYTGPACQELLPDRSCPSGFFGLLCTYPCHCKDSADCNRNGSCDNGCHKAWAGADCSIALPYSSKPATILDQTATTISLNISCNWDPLQDFGTGIITGCKLCYVTSQTTFTTVDINDNDVYVIDNLLPHTTVKFYTILSRLVGGEETEGPPSEHGSAETICTKPLEEPEIKLKTVDSNAIILTLKPVSNAPEKIQCDDILRYQVRHQNKDGNELKIVNTTDGLQTEVNISRISPCVFYEVDSRVVNNAEITGDWGKLILVQSAPSAPSITKDSVLEGTFLLMKWNDANCNSTQYNLVYHYQLFGGIHQGSTTKTEVLIDDGVVPCTQYTFSVFASYMNVSSTADIMEFMSGVDYPGKPIISSLTSTSSSITLELTLSDDNPCTILEYNVLVYSDLQNLEFNMDNTATSLTINEDIMPNTNYSVQVAARTQKGFGNFSDVSYVSTNDAQDNRGNKGATVGGVIGGLTVAISVIIVFVGIFVKRRRNASKEVHRPAVQIKPFDSENGMMPEVEGHANAVDVKSPDDEDDGAHPIENVYANSEPVYGNTNLQNQEYKPIELARLHDYVRKQNSSLKSGFEKEFEDIGNKPLYPWTAAKHSKNRTKNRYANIIPYDISRVVLDMWNNIPESDYINASYIDGYTTPREFIACQGPNVASVSDMWRMIWQEKSTVIVVVTNVFEGNKRKCEQYWPEANEGKTYANINVANVGENNCVNYVVRHFQLQKVETEEVHNVFQYHFTDWPDKSVPRTVPHLVDFIYAFRTAQQNSPSDSGPVIVHCSAGAGRTGTVIVIASMLDMAKQEGKVDVFNFVRSMREKRIQMVQTEEQYRFIYAVLLEELFCGQTQIPVTDLYQVIHEQQQVHGTYSTFEYQLKTLNSIYPRPTEDLTSQARLPDNILKNRSKVVLPLNKARPFLMTPCANGNDYINASFCDGYNKRNAFIVTQAPMSEPADTSVDFWRLVLDYKTDIIVQLNNKDETCAEYLPQRMNEELKTDKFTIEIKSYEENDLMIEQKIMLRKDNNVQEILHFKFRQWSEAELVPKVDSFVRFIAAVQRGHIPQHNQPIIIHCLDGSVRSGLFCSVYSIIDQIKEQKIVDVFQILKTLRSFCPTIVNTKVQYSFCYDAARSYLDGFEAYVNF